MSKGSGDRVVYVIPYEYKIYGTIAAFIMVLVIIPAVCYFPIIKPNLEKKAETLSKIEQGDVDAAFGDISEFISRKTAYSKAQEYDGKVVKFTGYITHIREAWDDEIYDDTVICINSEYEKNFNNETSWVWAYCGLDGITKTDLEQLFTEGDKVSVVGEIHTIGVSGGLKLRYCKVEHCNE